MNKRKELLSEIGGTLTEILKSKNANIREPIHASNRMIDVVNIRKVLEKWFVDAGFTVSDSESIVKLLIGGDVPHITIHPWVDYE